MSVERVYTQGEQALFATFDAAGLTGDERGDAIATIRETGLPTRKVEAFHYTDLRALLKGSYSIAAAPDVDAAKAAGAAFPRLANGAAVLHFRDGQFVDLGEAMPDGVTMTAGLPAALETTGPEDAVAYINTAFAQGGCTLDVAANTTVERPVGIAHTPVVSDALGATRVAITAGAGSTSTFIERGVGPDGAAYLHAPVVSLDIGEGACVTYTMAIEEGAEARRLGRFSATLATDSKLKLVVVTLGGALVRQELDFTIEGENVDLDIAGINMIGGESHIDITSRINHLTPNTVSKELFRNVATGRGRGVFQGQIKVAQAAQLTDARMACNTLLLSDDCDFMVKPELEIFADDVQCAHGATVADIEDSHLFYLRARGIPEAAARRLLVKAFVGEVLDEMEDEALAERLSDHIDKWMQRHV